MIYECIKDFFVESVDDNGFPDENKGEQVQIGSLWETEDSKATLTGAELRLNDLTGLRWIEISKKRLVSHFNELSEDSPTCISSERNESPKTSLTAVRRKKSVSTLT